MSDLETVEDLKLDRVRDPLGSFQREGVSRMRASLLSCTMDAPASSVKSALQQVTVMRVYHQISRIIKYLDLMDQLEEKLYSSIETTIDSLPDANPRTWMTLMSIQTQLQKNMIESQKLLEPFMATNFTLPEIQNSQQAESTAYIIPQESREKLRTSAQQILMELEAGDKDDEST